MPDVRIELLGHFRLTIDGRPIPAIHSRQQTLLACLVVNRHHPLSRQQVACQLWPDSGDAQALTNLRREIHNLRGAIPDAERYLVLEPGLLVWRDPGPCTSDVCDFEKAAGHEGADALLEAMRLYTGDVLPDCYDEWIIPERERLRTKYVEALRRLVALLEERRAYADAIEHAQKLLAAEPLEESTYLTLMRLLALKGDTAGAVRVYHACASVLDRELSVEPNPTLRAAYQRLLETRGPTPQASPPRATPPLVGRHAEWARLMAAWHASVEGATRMVLIRGEAGMGKTRLAEALAEWCTRQGIGASRARSFAMEGRLAYAPITDWLRSDVLRSALSRLDSPWLVEVSRLLPELAVERPDLPTPEPVREGWQRQRLFEALARAVLQAPSPLLLVLDDLQWTDRDTLEWLHYLLRAHAGKARLLIVGTVRTEEAADNAGLSELLPALQQLQRLIEIDVGPLNETDTGALAAHVAGRNLDARAAEQIFKQTEGHPLFVVEITRGGTDGPSTLPPQVQAAIAARLGRLSGPAKELVRVAATVGRDFTFEILREASDLEEKALVQALDELWQRRIVREHGVQGYDFNHDRIREVAYLEINPAARRLLHRRVAQALELLHPLDIDHVSAQVAAHYEYAGQAVRAVQFYRRAADVAGRVYAVEEVIRHLSRALALTRQLPESLERDKDELAMLLALSAALGAARGYPSPELEEAMIRTKALGETLGETVPVVQGLVGLSGVHLLRGENREAREYAERALALSEQLGEEHNTLRASCHWMAALVPYVVGDFERVRYHCEQCCALCDPDKLHLMVIGPDALMFGKAFNAHGLWLLGYPDQAAALSQAAIARAEHIRHPMSLAIAHAYAGLTHQFRRDRAATIEHARMAVQLCSRYGVAYYGEWGAVLTGWNRSWEHPGDESVALIQQGLENLQKLNTPTRRGYYLSLLAQALVRADRAEEARAVLDAAIATSAQTGESWWNAELYRLRGELSDTPERWFAQALEMSRSLGLKSLELRAATSLASLWKKREPARAYDVLAPVYGGFTEGFETPDLVEARTLLEELRPVAAG